MSQVDRPPHFPIATSRRAFLGQSGGGFGALALAWLLQADRASAGSAQGPKAPHFAARARSVIFLFMHGGPSHLENLRP